MSNWGYCKVGIFNQYRKAKAMPRKEGALPQMQNPGLIKDSVSKIIPTRAKTNAVVLDFTNAPKFGK